MAQQEEDRSIGAIESRSKFGAIIADSIECTSFVTVEVNGIKVDGIHGRQSGEIILSEESVRNAIWSLAKSIGMDEAVEAAMAKVA